MPTALLVFLFALAPTGTRSRLELDASAFFDGRALSMSFYSGGLLPGSQGNSLTTADGQWLAGGGGLGFTVFSKSLVDDDAAPPLQPFLQRAARFHLGGAAAGASIDYPGQAGITTKRVDGNVNAWADGYIDRWFYVGASLRAEFVDWNNQIEAPVRLPPNAVLHGSEILLPFTLEAGARLGNLRLSAGWGATPFELNGGDFQVRFWGAAYFRALAVVHRWLSLGGGLRVADSGAFVDADASFWFGRRLGVRVGIGGGHGAFVDSPRVFDSAYGSIGLEYWFRSRWSLWLTYAPSWQHLLPTGYGTQYTSMQHVLTIGLNARPR
jgi:hypothetical protein